MTLAALEDELTEAVERLRPTVVAIERGSGGPAAPTDPRPVTGSGSGVVWDRSGLIVTNEHVVRAAGQLTATLADGRTVPARLVGADPLTDVAVVSVPVGGLPAAPRVDSSTLRVGQIALAMGHSLGLPGGPTVSMGVVSALGRPLPGSDFVLEGLVQTDAAVNPGNSGGPLADRHGCVIGINSAMVPFAQGVGFAVPSNTVAHVVQELRTTGRVVRPWLGIQGATVGPEIARRLGLPRARGVVVTEVAEGGPAARAGLEAGDVVVRVASTGVRGLHDLVAAVCGVPIGAAVEVGVVRGGRMRTALVRAAPAPATGGRSAPARRS